MRLMRRVTLVKVMLGSDDESGAGVLLQGGNMIVSFFLRPGRVVVCISISILSVT